jgi:hypothetical protein
MIHVHLAAEIKLNMEILWRKKSKDTLEEVYLAVH